MRSKYACPDISASRIWAFIKSNRVLFSVICILLGLVECFKGLKMLKTTVFISVFGIIFMFMLIFFVELVIKPHTEYWAIWVILACSSIFAGIGGYFA